jgi:DNA-binding beta-propeller fold protein YncE
VVVVPPQPTITRFDGQLGGTPASPVLTLTWATENADHCQLTGTSELLDTQGTRPLPNPVDTGPILPAYTLTAYGAPGLPAATAVFDTPPRITRFTGTAVVNGAGMQLQLSWDTSLAESCTITGVPGALPASGTATVTPTVQAPLLGEYTLTATARGKSDTSTLSLQWGTQPVAQTQIPGYVATGMVATPDGTRLLVAASSSPGSVGAGQETVMLFSVTTLQPLAPPGVPVASGQGPIAIDPAGTRVFIASGATLAAFDAQTFEPLPGSPVALPIQGASVCVGMAVSATGDRVFVCSSASPTVFVVNAQTLAVTGQFQLPGPATAGGATADGLHLVFAASGSVLYTVDAQTYAPSAPSIPLPAALNLLFPLSVTITPDSSAAAVAGWQSAQIPTTMAVVDLRTQAVQVIPVPVPSPALWVTTVLAGSPDGSRLYAAATPASFHVFGDSPPSIQTSVFLRTVVSGGIG